MQKPKSVSFVSAIIIAFSAFSIMASGVFLAFFAVAQEVFYDKMETPGRGGLPALDQIILRNIFDYSWIILALALILLIGGIGLNKGKQYSKILLQGASVLAVILTAIPFASIVFMSNSPALSFLSITFWIVFALPFLILFIYLNRSFIKAWLNAESISPKEGGNENITEYYAEELLPPTNEEDLKLH